MRFLKLADYESLSRAAAQVIREAARHKPDMLFCAASGDTPTGTYAEMARTPDAFADMRVFKLDEWAGLPPDNPATCEAYLQETLIRPLGIPAERYQGFRGDAADLAAECARVDAWLGEHGPIDLCLLGLGRNGHLGLNEPADALRAPSHVAELADLSRTHPMLAATGGAVTSGLTLGMGGIQRARQVLLVVSGAHKREPLGQLVRGGISSQHPGSFLWLHADALCLCDEAAAAGLGLPDA